MNDDILKQLFKEMTGSTEPPKAAIDNVMEAIEILKNAEPYDPCTKGHVVSPSAHKAGYGYCANCFQPVGDWSKAVGHE